MSTNRGIFETFPSQAASRQESPFAVVHEPAAEQASAPSPFTPVARQESPFTVVDDGTDARPSEFGRPVKLPERRKVESPFQVAEPTEGFGFEAPSRAFAPSPFEPAQAAPAQSPFSAAPVQSPVPAFNQAPAPQQFAPAPQQPQPAYSEQPQMYQAAPTQVPSAFSPAPQQQPAPANQSEQQSDSFNIRQLELRAIFGVDREMGADEILQRSRALPGMRNIARVSHQDMATLDSLRSLLPSLGFGSGTLKLYSGSVPLEFIREGSVLLAVQTDGGFAPGVRETLMIVARELSRLG